MEYIVTRLNKDDLTKFRALNELFGDVFDDKNYREQLPSDEYLIEFLSDERNIVLVAERDEKVIGGAVAYVLPKFEQARKEVYLYDLAVATDRQRLGIGKALMDELRRVAKSIGAYTVFLQADEGDRAIKFYESLGPDENIKTRGFDFMIKG